MFAALCADKRKRDKKINTMNFILLFSPGPTEIIIILIVILLLFGGRKIPELMRGLGKGMKEFKKAQKDLDEDEDDDNASEKKAIDKEKKQE